MLARESAAEIDADLRDVLLYMSLSGRAKYTNSKMQNACGCCVSAQGLTERTPSLSMTMISPGAMSRTYSA